jgi:AcrR family transcriptional regulator
MARPSDPEKKEKIIKAAITIFAQTGYTGTRIAEVAEAAGIGKGTIYEYFRSKEDLFFATFEYLIFKSVQQIDDFAQSFTGSASTRLMEMAETVMKTWLADLDLYGLVLEFWSATSAPPGRKRFREAFKTVYANLRRIVAGLIEKGISRGEFKPDINPEQIASALIGSWDALLFQVWFDPDFDPLGASQSHMAVVVAGLQRRHSLARD